jgi:photosystem II stability/assembly factor-like uncharacterized protein
VLNGDDAWAVGELGIVLHCDGSDWRDVVGGGTDVLNSVFFACPNDVWMVGRPGTLFGIGGTGIIYHWNGTALTFVTSPTSNMQSLNSVFMLNDTDGWVVGQSGTIIRWNGTQWIPEFSRTPDMLLITVLALVTATIIAEKMKRPKTL